MSSTEVAKDIGAFATAPVGGLLILGLASIYVFLHHRTTGAA